MGLVNRLKIVLAIEGIITLIVCSFMLRLSIGLWRPFLNVYFNSIGIPIITIGLFNSMRDLISSLTMIPAGSVSDKVGRKKPILVSIMLYLVFICLLVITRNVWILFIAFSLEGLAMGINGPATAGYVADIIRGARSGMAFASLSFFSISAGIISTIVGAFIAERLGFLSNFKITAFVLIFTFLIAYLLLRESLIGKLNGFKRSLKTSIPELLPNLRKVISDRNMRLLLSGSMLHHLGARLAQTYLSLYATVTLGFDLVTLGWLLSIRRIGDVLGQLPSGKIIERFGGEITLFLHVLSAAPTAYLFATSNNLILTAIVMVVWGTELGWEIPSRRVLSVKYGESLGRATAMGYVQSLISLIGIVSPIIGALMWNTYGSISVYYASFAINIVACLPLSILVYRSYTNSEKK